MRLFGRRDDGPVATYAAVLDGAHLWLEVDGGQPALSGHEGRDTVDVGAGPLDLTTLPGTSYDVVVGRTPVRSLVDPRRSPPAPDGSGRWELQRVEGDALRLVRHPLEPTAELDALDVREGRLHLRLTPPGDLAPGSHLLLLDQDDAVLATLPVTAHDHRVETLLGVDDLPPGFFGVLRLALGTPTAHARIRRPRNVLADSQAAVLLPELHEEGADQPRARLRWNPDGLLALRCSDPREPA